MKFILLLILCLGSYSVLAKDCRFKASPDILKFATKMMQKKGCQLDQTSNLELVFEKEVTSMMGASHFGAVCPLIEISMFHYSLIDTNTGAVVAHGSDRNVSDVKYSYEYIDGEAIPKDLIYCGYENFLYPTIRKSIKRLMKDYYNND